MQPGDLVELIKKSLATSLTQQPGAFHSDNLEVARFFQGDIGLVVTQVLNNGDGRSEILVLLTWEGASRVGWGYANCFRIVGQQ